MQNAYIESLNSRFRDERLSQHWFASLSHMRGVIDNWRGPTAPSALCRGPCLSVSETQKAQPD
jgi:hypothetical protein